MNQAFSSVADGNNLWCATLLDALVRCGVRHAVLSPGARSTPLALAALEHPALAAQMVLDERSAAFFALGLAKADGNPVVLIATSGSAIANWGPAVMEADAGHVPLVLLSADRPPELQDCGANQAMEQTGLFGSHLRASHALPPPDAARLNWLPHLAARLVQQALSRPAGPVQANIPLPEPLVSPHPMPAPQTAPPRRLPRQPGLPVDLSPFLPVLERGHGLIQCGPTPLSGPEADAITRLADHLEVPVLADLPSGLRGRPGISPCPDALARCLPAPDWCLRFGATPISRAVQEYLHRLPAAAHLHVGPAPADPLHGCGLDMDADPAALCHALADRLPSRPGWRRNVAELEQRIDRLAEQLCREAENLSHPFEGSVCRAILSALPPCTPVFLGNSLSVRCADWFCGPLPHPLPIHANRGVSGIDGNLSTFFGLACGTGRPGLAILGDLTLIHDSNALGLGRHGPAALVLLDNGGGGIFDHLPQAGLPHYQTGWLATQEVDFQSLAQAHRLSYVRADSAVQAEQAVRQALDTGPATLIHVPIQRQHSLDTCRRFHHTIAQWEP